MIEFMKKAVDWVLQKEQEAAQECHISVVDVDKQIETMQNKKDSITAQYSENIEEIDHVLGRLESIKKSANKCTK
ncbi:MAG: hypothetical protein GQ570_08005 [Helicobacteraceae bacterium]|nr:hypothetical protein [Helicobacteraceae bacterium]